MERRAYLGVDSGGTAVKAAIFDPTGSLLGAGAAKVTTSTPAPGHTERDMEEMWQGVLGSIRAAMAAAPPDTEIAAVGVTGYGNGLFALDADGRPTHPAVLSTDRRATSIVERWQAEGFEPAVRESTWQGFWTGKPLPLLAWLASERPEVIERTASVVSCKDYVRYRLTDELASEVTDLSSACLIDGSTLEPPTEVWRRLGMAWVADLVPRPMLRPDDVAGHITAEVAAATGLRAGTPVVAGGEDTLMMHLGSGITDTDTVGINAGTWSINQRFTRGPAVVDGSRFMTALSHDPDMLLALEGSPTSAGNLSWFIRNVVAPASEIESSEGAWYERSNAEVESVTSKADSPLFVPQVNGAFETSRARGAFLGLGGWHTRADLLRAIYEGVALEHRLHVERLVGDERWPSVIRLSGGAARSHAWVGIFADTLGTAIEVPSGEELGALGLAILAASGTGDQPSIEDAVAAMTTVESRTEPGAGGVADPALRRSLYRKAKEATLEMARAQV